MNLFVDYPNEPLQPVDYEKVRLLAAELKQSLQNNPSYLQAQKEFRIARQEHRTVRCSRCKDEAYFDTVEEAAAKRSMTRWRCDDCLVEAMAKNARERKDYSNRIVVGIRHCPKCGIEMKYYSKGGFWKSSHANASCGSCSKMGRTKDIESVYFSYGESI